MWILRSSKGDTYQLLTGKQHIVGRKDADLLLQNDQSISRKHAILELEHKSENWANPCKLPIVKLLESGSKYGTSVISGDGEKHILPAHSTYILKDGDQIQFGLQWNLWKLEHKTLVVSHSTLSSEEKKNVKAVVVKLGGHVVDSWSSLCTHLTMCSVTLTVKAVCALADGKPIVTPEMWNRYLASAEANLPPPNYEDFIPPLGESVIKKNEVSFKVNEHRRTLFKEKKFLFFTRTHCNQHQCLVLAAGGTPVCLQDVKISKKELISPNVIVMQIAERSSQPSQAPSLYAEYTNYLQESSKRLIPVSEIGLAILHCSLDKYCNPSFSFASTMLKAGKPQVVEESSEQVLAMDTQEVEALCGKIKASSTSLSERNRIIPATGTCENSITTAQAVVDADHQNTASLDITSHTIKPLVEPCSRLEMRVERSPLAVKQMSVPSCSKRKSEDEFAPSNIKRQHLCIKEEYDTEEDLFAFASDKEETKNEADLFSFVEDHVKDTKENELKIKEKPQKRKVSGDGFPHVVTTKKPHIDSTWVPDPSKEQRNLETVEEFITLHPKIQDIARDGEQIMSGVSKTVVLLKDMLIRRSENSSIGSTERDTDVENFKKFRKARPPYQRAAPVIIGGNDLVVYEGNNSCNNKTRNDNEVGSDDTDEEVVDEWAFQLSQKINRVKVQ